MKLEDLIGKEITDLLISYKTENYGFDEADCYLVLNKNLTVGLPFSIDDEVWIRESDKIATSIFTTSIGNQKNAGITWLIGSKITDFIQFPEGDTDKAFVELSNGMIITEIPVAPNGTGLAGLAIFESIQKLEARFGDRYTRLSEKRAIPNKV